MKMKSIFNKKILIAIATISSLSLQSCLDDDDNYAMRFPNALVTVKTDADQTVFLQLDDKTTLLPTNMTKSPYGEKEVRALVNYKEVDEPSDIYTQAVHINWIDSILTKPIAPDLGEENDTVYGTDPVPCLQTRTPRHRPGGNSERLGNHRRRRLSDPSL